MLSRQSESRYRWALNRHLSLSTNSIDRMINLTGMTRLKILSLGRNVIKRVRARACVRVFLPFCQRGVCPPSGFGIQIERLDDVADTLEELWLSYNQISSLDGLSNLRNLTTLYLANNNIRSWTELDKIVSSCRRPTALTLRRGVTGVVVRVAARRICPICETCCSWGTPSTRT